jgi:hypothetical protein
MGVLEPARWFNDLGTHAVGAWLRGLMGILVLEGR